MKKLFFFAALAFIFASCSSDGSREIQVDEVDFVPNDISDDDDYSKVESIFEVVPGNYPITWHVRHNLPQQKEYEVSLSMKLRLKKHVDVLPSAFDEVREKNPRHLGFRFYLIDANGKKDEHMSFDFSSNPLDEWMNKGVTNKDAYVDFLNFLNSKPGTEIDVVAIGGGWSNNQYDCIEIIKNTKKIVCEMSIADKFFEKYFGTIK